MHKFTKFIEYFARFLQMLLILALALLGIILILLLFREIYSLFDAFISPSISRSNAEIMDEIIVFFLFFEFAAMVISALHHHGHTSINFLMGLGITALLRGLITAHSNLTEVIGNSVAILLLVIGMVIFNRNIKEM